MAAQAWAAAFHELAATGATEVELEVFWGEHEATRGLRDFGRTSRLKLERVFGLAMDAGLNVTLRTGFSRSDATIPVHLPSWTPTAFGMESAIASVLVDEGEPSLSFRPYPSLWSGEFQTEWRAFLQELFSLVHLYQSPEGPVVRVLIDWGIYAWDAAVIGHPAMLEWWVQEFREIRDVNLRYGTQFKEFGPLVFPQGMRTLNDKRPWHAAFDYKRLRARVFRTLESDIQALPEASVLGPILKFVSPRVYDQEGTAPFTLRMDPTLLEVSPSRHAAPCTPMRLVSPQAVQTYRLWEWIRSNALSASRCSVGYGLIDSMPKHPEKLQVILCGKYLSRENAKRLLSSLAAGVDLFFLYTLPTYDEKLQPIQWGNSPHLHAPAKEVPASWEDWVTLCLQKAGAKHG